MNTEQTENNTNKKNEEIINPEQNNDNIPTINSINPQKNPLQSETQDINNPTNPKNLIPPLEKENIRFISSSLSEILDDKEIPYLNDYYKEEESKILKNNKKTAEGKILVEMNEILGEDAKIPVTLDIMKEDFLNFPNCKIASKDFGIIKSYAANTSQGIIRDYNEDRVSIVINLSKPQNLNNEINWPKICYFGVFDGHAGNKCAEFLRDNLLSFIINNDHFPKDINNAIKTGYLNAEKIFLETTMNENELLDKSGSCALILLTINSKIYIANVGDSRCLISMNYGKIMKDVTRDHKPNYPYEKNRIIKNGGYIYQCETPIELENGNILNDKVLLGPYRVFPGRLSVSRTIGDAEAKIKILGGNPNVIIPEPDIYEYDLKKDDIDFFILGCDGIYDQLSSKDIFECAWLTFNKTLDNIKKNHSFLNKININSICGDIVDFILKMSMIRRSFDNVTCLMVSLKNIIDLTVGKNIDEFNKNDNIFPNVTNNALKNFIENNNLDEKVILSLNKEKATLFNKKNLPTLKKNYYQLNIEKQNIILLRNKSPYLNFDNSNNTSRYKNTNKNPITIPNIIDQKYFPNRSLKAISNEKLNSGNNITNLTLMNKYKLKSEKNSFNDIIFKNSFRKSIFQTPKNLNNRAIKPLLIDNSNNFRKNDSVSSTIKNPEYSGLNSSRDSKEINKNFSNSSKKFIPNSVDKKDEYKNLKINNTENYKLKNIPEKNNPLYKKVIKFTLGNQFLNKSNNKMGRENKNDYIFKNDYKQINSFEERFNVKLKKPQKIKLDFRNSNPSNILNNQKINVNSSLPYLHNMAEGGKNNKCIMPLIEKKNASSSNCLNSQEKI